MTLAELDNFLDADRQRAERLRKVNSLATGLLVRLRIDPVAKKLVFLLRQEEARDNEQALRRWVDARVGDEETDMQDALERLELELRRLLIDYQ